MKSLLLLLCLVSFTVFGQDLSDSQLTSQNNSTIRLSTYTPAKNANMFQSIIDNKLHKDSAVLWSNITGTPTSFSGYGITSLGGNLTLTSNLVLNSSDTAISFRVNENGGNRIIEAGESGGTRYVKMDFGSDATGDIPYRNSSGNLTRLPIGSNNQYLSISGGLPTWVNLSIPELTASNGITKNGNNFSLGGTVSTGVDLNVTGDGYVFIGESSNNFFAGPGFISLSGLTFIAPPTFITAGSTDMQFTDAGYISINPSGTDAIRFSQAPVLSSSLAIPHKGYVDDLARPLYKSVTVAGNIGSGEDVIYTYTVPGGTLVSDGEELVLTSFGTFAGVGNNPVVRIRFGSSLLYEHTHAAFSNAVWKIEAHVIRTSATTQKAFIVFTTMVEGINTRITRSTGTETLSSSAVFQLTAEGISDNDFVGEYFEVKKLSD